jgi:hypothetical protein
MDHINRLGGGYLIQTLGSADAYRSLAPCISAHFLITLALEPGLIMAAVTGEWRHTKL